MPYWSHLRGISGLNPGKTEYSRTLHQAEAWAKKVLEKYPATAESPDPHVEILEEVRTVVSVVRLEKPKP